ncbi:8-oxo-dGTP diphosphatase [Cognatishimia maritima]|uniref:8-oxo-dGTP diphosphatase n=2 Tax=Cognatishimia maritima TaxID=870908 RepID=A0A1M5SNP2_9RHOB|nr:8-oxo-dGTP diphosphatase [Cognatishimia maritima]
MTPAMAETPNLAFVSDTRSRFYGAKVTVFVGSRIVTILRDNKAVIPFPGHWDLPGGGREGKESAWDCAARECQEETALVLDRADLLWGRPYQTGIHTNWFFVACISEDRAAGMTLGDEGQALKLMTADEYLCHPKAIPHFQKRLADWIAGCAGAL